MRIAIRKSHYDRKKLRLHRNTGADWSVLMLSRLRAQSVVVAKVTKQVIFRHGEVRGSLAASSIGLIDFAD